MKQIQLIGHSRPITQVLVNYTGDLLFTSGKDGRICVWEVQNGRILGAYDTLIDGKAVNKAVWGIDVTMDSQFLIVASAEGVFIFRVETKVQVLYLCVNSVCRSVQWNTKPGKQNRFVIARDCFKNIVTAAIVVYELDHETMQVKEILQITQFTKKCLGVAWGAYDATLVSRHEDGLIIIWDADTGAKVFERQAHTKDVSWMEFSQDRTLCLTCSTDSTAKLWTTHNWKEIQTFTTDRPLNCCSICPLYNKPEEMRRLHILLAGGQKVDEVTTTKTQEGKQEVLLVHMLSAELLGLVPGHFSPVNSVTFLPDGKGFVSGAEEGYARIYQWDPNYFNPNKFP